MPFQFATCDRNSALAFLRKLYPSAALADEGPTKELLDLVQADEVRVQDPDFHRPAEIVPGTKWKEDAARRAEVVEVCKRFHDAATRPSVPA
jgi:hypothetical protein